MSRLGDDEVRILALGAPTLLKLLEMRQQRCLDRLFGEFKNGKLDQLGNLADYCAIRDQINDIKSALTQYEKSEGARHANRNDDGGAAGTAD